MRYAARLTLAALLFTGLPAAVSLAGELSLPPQGEPAAPGIVTLAAAELATEDSVVEEEVFADDGFEGAAEDETAAEQLFGDEAEADAESEAGVPSREASYAAGAAQPLPATVHPLPAAPNTAAAKKAAAAKKKKAADLKKAVAGAYKPVFYDNNFAYIDNPAYKDWYFGDGLKRNRIGNFATVDIGGQMRSRFHSERNFRGLGLTGVDDKFLLSRTRLFANVEMGQAFRVYGEMIDADSRYENFTPRGIEENKTDMLNLFADLRLWDGTSGDLKFRAGRQELIYGSERLISPLDWANTRRTFEGYKLMWVGEDWNIDGFYTRPVLVKRNEFDSPDYRQEFFGSFATYKGFENQTIDMYFLKFDNSMLPNSFKYGTMGSRWLGTKGEYLWELEGGYQYGSNTDNSAHDAWFFTTGAGKKFEDVRWKPTVWLYYDYASGGLDRGAGQGFNHLFPLGHKYLGFMDLFGRSNIQTPNLLVTAQPHEKVKLLMWYYYFFLTRENDTPYNVTMSPFAAGSAPRSRDLGHEIDTVLTYTITPRTDILFGYSHFFSGQYYKQTPGLPYRGDADFFYTQLQWNF
jgi:hypothetical protein